jgi:ABC-2 type transport system permease protein
MFRKIFIFEVQNRLRRPAVYLYFAAALVFTIMTFATDLYPWAIKSTLTRHLFWPCGAPVSPC